MTQQPPPPPGSPGEALYIEFGVQSNFSFLRGASKPEELVVAAAMLGHAGMGLADRNTVAGVVRAWSQARTVFPEEAARLEGFSGPARLFYHPGCRLVFADGTPDILAYPRDRQGWGHLCRMLTQANMRGQKGAPLLHRDDLFEWGDHMSLAVLPELAARGEDTLSLLRGLHHRFGPALRLAVSPDYGGGDRLKLERAATLAEMARMPLMAINDVLYHTPDRRPLQDVLTAIRLNVPVARVGLELTANAERHMKPGAEMARLFRKHPEALRETLLFARELDFSLKQLQHNYPEETTDHRPTD